MRISMYKDFLRSQNALSENDRKRVWNAVLKLESQPVPLGLRWHRLWNGFVSLQPYG